MKLIIVIFCALLLGSITVDPMPLPEKFTQSFTLSDKDGDSCTGKIFYDSTKLAQKITMIGNSNYCCDSDHDSCNYMLINGTGYLILPTEKFCCYLSGLLPSIPRDIFQKNFTYKGQKSVDGEKCYLWVMEVTDNVAVGVYTDKTQKRIMKEAIIQTYTGVFHDDIIKFWQGSYSEKFSDKTVFEVPSYCTEKCDLSKFKLLNPLFALKNLQSSNNHKNLHQNEDKIAEE